MRQRAWHALTGGIAGGMIILSLAGCGNSEQKAALDQKKNEALFGHESVLVHPETGEVVETPPPPKQAMPPTKKSRR